jgi:hypothetical protein
MNIKIGKYKIDIGINDDRDICISIITKNILRTIIIGTKYIGIAYSHISDEKNYLKFII